MSTSGALLVSVVRDTVERFAVNGRRKAGGSCHRVSKHARLRCFDSISGRWLSRLSNSIREGRHFLVSRANGSCSISRQYLGCGKISRSTSTSAKKVVRRKPSQKASTQSTQTYSNRQGSASCLKTNTSSASKSSTVAASITKSENASA